YAQGNWVSVFGNSAGCGSKCNTFNTPPGATLASQVAGINPINDDIATPGNVFPAANATYSPTGQVLFSTDQNGIYNPDGSPVYKFTDGYHTTIGSYTFTAYEAVSDVAVFP